MAKYCPILNRKVVYLECLECEEKLCKQSDLTLVSKDDSNNNSDSKLKN